MNPQEATGRALKAAALADVLTAVDFAAADVKFFTDKGWDAAAAFAGLRRGYPMGSPSAATRRLVAQVLADRETAADDPFAGIAGVTSR